MAEVQLAELWVVPGTAPNAMLAAPTYNPISAMLTRPRQRVRNLAIRHRCRRRKRRYIGTGYAFVSLAVAASKIWPSEFRADAANVVTGVATF